MPSLSTWETKVIPPLLTPQKIDKSPLKNSSRTGPFFRWHCLVLRGCHFFIEINVIHIGITFHRIVRLFVWQQQFPKRKLVVGWLVGWWDHHIVLMGNYNNHHRVWKLLALPAEFHPGKLNNFEFEFLFSRDSHLQKREKSPHNFSRFQILGVNIFLGNGFNVESATKFIHSLDSASESAEIPNEMMNLGKCISFQT